MKDNKDMKEPLDNCSDPILEECLQAMRVHGENLDRQQRLSDSIDRMAAAQPARRRPLFLYYTLGGVAACLALFFLFSRFSGAPQKLQPEAEVARLQPDTETTHLQPESEMAHLQTEAEVAHLQQDAEATYLHPKAEVTHLQPKSDVTSLQPEATHPQLDMKIAHRPSETEALHLQPQSDVTSLQPESTHHQLDMKIAHRQPVRQSHQDSSVVPERSDFDLAVTAMHPQPSDQEEVVADALPAILQPSADTVLPLPDDSQLMDNPLAEIITMHTLVSYKQPARERKFRLPFRRYSEHSRETTPVTPLFIVNLQNINH